MKIQNRKPTVVKLINCASVMFFICLLTSAVLSQNRYNGTMRNTENYRATITGNVTVFTRDGSNNLVAANDISGCDSIAVSGNTVTPGSANYFCFQSSSSTNKYYVKFGTSGTPYLWLSENLRSPEGFYSIEEFGASRDSVNNTYPLKNALAYIGSRPESGGKLKIPNGVFKVESGSNPSTLPNSVSVSVPAVLPPGITIYGTNGKTNFSSSRIQVDVGNKTIFKIGGLTDSITIRDLGLVTPLESVLVSGATKYQYRPGTIAIYASDETPYSSQHMLFSNLTIQGFEHGIYVKGCNPDGAGCGSTVYRAWQFDYVKLEDSNIDAFYGVRVDAKNSDWVMTNTTFNTGNSANGLSRGVCVLIEKAGEITMDNVFGGAPHIEGSTTNRSLRPEAFIKVSGIDTHATLNLRGVESEETDHSLLYEGSNPFLETWRFPIHLEGSNMGDPVTIKNNVILISVGNSYWSNTVQVLNPDQGGSSTSTQIYSYGDSFSGVTYQLQICPGFSFGVSLPSANTADCRRDFYVYNNLSNGETNTVVTKTAQKRVGTYDSSGIDQNQVQSPLRIMSPPHYTATLNTGDTTNEHFKFWGYTLRRNTSDGYLDFEGNQKPPEFAWNATGFRFYGNVLPSADNTFTLGNASFRWSLIRGVTITSGDTILSNKETGEELYKIHEDDNFIYFQDIRTGKEMMRLDRQGNLFVAGKVYENGETPEAKKSKTTGKTTPVRKAIRKKRR